MDRSGTAGSRTRWPRRWAVTTRVEATAALRISNRRSTPQEEFLVFVLEKRNRTIWVVLLSAAVSAGVGAQQQQQQPQPPVPSAAPTVQAGDTRPIHIYIRSGLKSHGEGAHDYPQFSADWSKILTDHGALVDGSFHFPSAQELANTDVMVMYKG